MSKSIFKKAEFQTKDVSASNFLCGENLLSYVKSNLSIDGNYVLVVKYNVLDLSVVLRSNKLLDYNFLISDYDRIIIGLYNDSNNIILNDIISKVGCSKKELVSHIDFFMAISHIYYMENKLYEEELLFSVIKFLVLKDYNNYEGNITMYFVSVDNYIIEVLDNIINRYDV